MMPGGGGAAGAGGAGGGAAGGAGASGAGGAGGGPAPATPSLNFDHSNTQHNTNEPGPVFRPQMPADAPAPRELVPGRSRR
jgi:hypothetical protein